MKKSILLSVVCFLIGTIVYTQDWVTFTKTTPEQPIIELIGSDNQQVEFHVEVCGMYKTDITEEGEPFKRIEIPGAGKTDETGSPELPYIRQLIAIPECEDVVLTVNITGQTDFSNYNIYPAPGYEEVQNPDGTVYLQEVFTKDEAVYSQNQYMPGMNAEIVSTGYLRDQKYAEVYLYPVQFNPVLKHINVFTHYQITLDFINPTTPVNVNTGIFNNVATHTMLNYVSSGITASINDNVQGDGNVQWIELTDPAQADNIVADYLIICADNFFEPSNPDSEVLRIANHRASYNGFDVAILNANDLISVYYDPENFPYEKERAIRECIRRIYEGENAQHTYDGKLGYVLLVGDVYGDNEGMPISKDESNGCGVPWGGGEWYPNDYYYSCVTNINDDYDEFGDIYIGRFSVENEIELHNMVEKTIFFESEYSFEDWRNNVVFSNGVNNSFEDDYPLYYDLMNEIISEQFQVSIYNGYEMSTNAVKYMIGESINNGTLIQIYKGHGGPEYYDIDTWVYFDTDYFNSTITNNGKYPISLNFACNTGWLDYTEDDIPVDCFSEFTTSYSENKGFVGCLGSSRQIQGFCNTDLDNISTTIPNAIFTNLSHIAGEFILEGKALSWINQERFGPNYFGDPALNIMAQGFEVTRNITLSDFTTISTEITVRPGAYLSVPSNGILYLEGEGKLIIEEGAGFSAVDAIVQGQSLNNKIIVNGSINLHSAELSALPGQSWSGVYLDNDANNYVVYNTTIENCFISGKSKKLTVQNSTFNNSGLKYQKGNLVVVNSTFNNSKIEATDGYSKLSYVEIKSGCTIQNCDQEPAIYIDGYYNYSIDDCTISGNSGDGIGIFNSGGTLSTKEIKNNTIINNGLEHNGSGIEIYHSYVQIYGDQLIEGNKYGISCFNNSNVSIRGNNSANYIYETQIIRDNEKHQVYASQNSFPYDFHWNAVIDEDNQYPLVYYGITIGFPEVLNVRNNYWGNSFTPSEDLYPYEYYNYLPIWNLNSGGGSNDAEMKYNSAQSKIAEEDYTGAKIEFQQIVTDYPTSKFAQAALRELYSLEEYATDDYTSLKTYYNSEAVIQTNPDLAKLAEYLTNFCEIKLENYPTAISWFENVIQNPETIEDSIFAIIDLGYTYFLMENGGLKSAYTGKMIEHIPVSKKQFEEKRDYLLTLLYNDNDSQTNENLEQELNSLKANELLQNIPNPFSGITDIYYKLDKDAAVEIHIYDYSGRQIQTINRQGTKGLNKVQFDSSGLPAGVYFYNLEINGSLSDSKKMTILK